MKTKLRCLVIVFSFSFLNVAFSQQGKVDASFNTYDDGLLGDGFDNTVRTVSLQADGKLIAGGDYLNFNGAATPYLCRLFPDGSKDSSFDSGTGGINGKVYCSLILPDGKIILGGSFTKYNGEVSNRFIRLNSDGSRDATFNTLIGANSGIIYATALQSDGSIIIVGSFTKYNGINANRVARILPNGNLDPSFGTGTGASGLVDEVQIQSDGKIIVAGSFVTFNGTACNKIVRLNADGSIDTTFVIGIGFDDDISALFLQPDGKVLVGGDFTSYNGTATNRLIRLNNDGSIDASFATGTGFSNNGVATIKVDSSDRILVGGSFTGTYNGTAVNRLVLLDSNGVLNPQFDIGSGPASATVYTLTDTPDGSWFVGGSFSVFDSQNQGRLAKIDAAGTLDIGYLTAGVGFDNSVLKVLTLSDNKMMTFGSFTKFNGASSTRVSRLLLDGTLDASFNSSGAGANNTVRSAVIQTDGKIIMGGDFTNYNGVASGRLVRINPDGAIDASFTIGTAANSTIYALVLQSDGKIIIGGNFTKYNGTTAVRVARLMANGDLDTSFTAGFGADGIVESILLQTDGKIVLGGHFTAFNGTSNNRLVRLNTDGSVDLSFFVGLGFDKNVYTTALQSDGKLIVGGSFLNYNGGVSKRIVRLNSDGSLDATFVTGSGFSNGDVKAILVQPDGKLLIGGTFSGTYNGTIVKRIVRLSPTGILDTTFSANLNSPLNSMCFTPNNKLMIGGNFNSVSGISKHRIARLLLCMDTTVWDGLAWSNGVPSSEKAIIFNGNYPVLNSVTVCSCSINTGNSVGIPSGNTLGLVFDYSGLGTLILDNSASLYQSEDEIKNTGIIVYKRETMPMLKFDYTYWSSPVSNQRLIDVSPDTLSDKFFSFNAASASWFTEDSANTMKIGEGYIIRGPQSFSTTTRTVYEAIFKGIPNNGLVSVPIATTDTSNLIGNPYPSAIDADSFINANKEVLDGTIYLWTHNTAIDKNLYTSNDYAVYNLLGGVGTSAATNSGVNNAKPDGEIASGQAFFVTSSIIGGGVAVFNNSMRVVGQNLNFFKSDTTKKSKSNEIERHRIWLNLSNSEGAFKQTLIGYATGATNDFDSSFDGESFDGNQFVDFYSINQDKNLVIQGRALPFDETDEVPLGYRSTIDGTFTINIDQTDGLLTNQAVFIEDKSTNTIFDLKSGNYTFSTVKGTFDDRLVLRYTNKSLGTDDFSTQENQVLVSNKNKQIKINSTLETIDKVLVYDIAGKQIYQKTNVNSNELSISNLVSSHQVLMVKTSLQNGKTVTNKIIN